MDLQAALQLNALRPAQVVAGASGLSRLVRWAHVVDHPEVLPWVQAGQLLLSTGFNLPRDPADQRALVRELECLGLAGVVLAVPGFWTCFTDEMRREADEVGLPLLELPWEVPFSLISEELHTALLAEQFRVVEASEDIHRRLTRAALDGDSLHDLAHAVEVLLGRSVRIEDAGGRVLAESGSGPDLGQDVTFTPVRFKGETVASLRVSGPLEPLDVRALEHAATVAALHISRQRELTQLEVRLGYGLVDALLEGQVGEAPASLERLTLMGFDAGTRYWVGAAQLDAPLPLSRDDFLRREALAARMRREIQDLGQAALISVSLNLVHCVLPEACPPDRLWSRLSDHALALVVSRAHPGVAGVYQAAKELHGLLQSNHPTCGLVRYDTLLLPRVLLGEEEARGSFVREIFEPIESLRNGHTLIETLAAFVESGFHFKRAAHRLGIHVSTLRYRLERVSDATTWHFDDQELRFRLDLAVRLRRLTE